MIVEKNESRKKMGMNAQNSIFKLLIILLLLLVLLIFKRVAKCKCGHFEALKLCRKISVEV